LKQKKKPFGSSSIFALGVSPVSLRTAIKELVPGDSGGNTLFSDMKIREGIEGSGGEIV
jgi:hypothetical protein